MISHWIPSASPKFSGSVNSPIPEVDSPPVEEKEDLNQSMNRTRILGLEPIENRLYKMSDLYR